MLRVRLVGGLELERDGATIPPPSSRRARALLAWLALRPGMHARSELAARFWPDVLDESARASLRAALTELRAALGDAAPALVATRDAVGLDGGVWVDVREYSALLRDDVEQAVELGTGELLSGIDDDWVHEARAEHAETIATALEALAVEAERRGDRAEAARRTRAALALDPLSEEWNRRLIRRLAAAGDAAAAITAYEQLTARLRTNLGIAPSATTRELARAIRDGALDDQHTRPVPAGPPEIPPPDAVMRAAERLFVGRGRELAHLRAAWAGVRLHNVRRAVLLAGEPGIGKTLTALRLAQQALDDGAVVLLGRCSEEPLGAYEPFAEVLRHVIAALGSGRLAALVGDSMSEVTRLLGGTSSGERQPPGARERLFDGVDAALEAVAAGRPLLLLLDDLHWADRPTLALLRSLLRSARRVPVLVIGGYRTTELGRRTPLAGTLAELLRDGAVERVPLGGLAAEDVSALAGLRLGGDAGEGLAASLHARAGGNALFVDEVLRGMAEGSVDPVPESVRQAIGFRLSRLSDAADTLLGVAAILGEEADVGTLEAVADLPSAEAALDELIRARLLEESPSRPRTVAFAHALVRETVYGDLNALRRARLHRRAAEVLIAASEEAHLDAIAHHLFEGASATDAERTVEYLARAGARADSMLAYEAAAGFYGRALEVLDSGPRVGELLVSRGEALQRAGDPVEARRCFTRAADAARAAGNTSLLGRAALGHAGIGVSILAVDARSVALLEEALTAATDPTARSELLARLAVELYYAPSRDRSEALSEDAVATAHRAGDSRAVASALNARHVALWRPDRLDERRTVAEEMIAAAHQTGDRALEVQARNWLVVDLWELGDVPGWRAERARHDELAAALRLPSYTWYAPMWGAVEALHAGRFADAHRLADVARAAGERAGEPNAEVFARMLEFQSAALRGDPQGLDWGFLADKISDSPAGMAYRCGSTWLLALSGREDDARAELAVVSAEGYAGIAFDTNWPSAMGECAEACALLDDRDAAEPLYELLAPYAGRPLTAGRAVCSYGVADRHLGMLATVLERHDAAVAHLERALELDARAGMRPWVIHGRNALARALERRGDAATARAAQESARAEAAALGIAIAAGRR
jgi:DNA-binding SARP family transcriptional activator